MPTYAYRCSNCEKEMEIVHKITEDARKECPLCHQSTLSKQIPSSLAIQFKGSDFYVNDYGCSKDCSSCSKKCGS